MWASFALAMVPLVWILWTVISKGAHLLLDPQLVDRAASAASTPTTSAAARYHAIEGTLIQAGITARSRSRSASCTADLPRRVRPRRGSPRAISFMVDILTGVPSIVAALFIYAVWVTMFGFHRIGFAVSLSLVLLMLPVVVRSTEEMLKLVPNELREASYALGVPKWKTIVQGRPAAPPSRGIITGILLGLARVMGETAPLLILGRLHEEHQPRPLQRQHGRAADDDQPGPQPTSRCQPAADRIWGAALTLILLVLSSTSSAELIARFGSVKSSNRKEITRWQSESTSPTSTSTTATSRPSRT